MASEQNEGAEQATNTPAVGLTRMTVQNEGPEQATSAPTVGLTGMIEERYKKMKEHVETYPYVWASYAVVYGGFGLWFTYRWRRLRKTEDRVRALQKRLRELTQAEEVGSSSAQKSSLPSGDNKPTK